MTPRLEMAKKPYQEGDVFSYRLRKNRRGQFALSWKIDDAAGLLLILSWAVIVLVACVSKSIITNHHSATDSRPAGCRFPSGR